MATPFTPLLDLPHTKKILQAIAKLGVCTQQDIADQIDIGSAVLYTRLCKLSENGYILRKRAKPGNPTLFSISNMGTEAANASLHEPRIAMKANMVNSVFQLGLVANR